jgi:hypothetical protein
MQISGLGGLVLAHLADALRAEPRRIRAAHSAIPACGPTKSSDTSTAPARWGNPLLEQKAPLRSNTCTTNRGLQGPLTVQRQLWITTVFAGR